MAVWRGRPFLLGGKKTFWGSDNWPHTDKKLKIVDFCKTSRASVEKRWSLVSLPGLPSSPSLPVFLAPSQALLPEGVNSIVGCGGCAKTMTLSGWSSKLGRKHEENSAFLAQGCNSRWGEWLTSGNLMGRPRHWESHGEGSGLLERPDSCAGKTRGTPVVRKA